ncbi:hypothetical protein LR69_02694 [Geobacillus sp. BCO2]|nr:hypothetical protein LR69_02694 [Geobacillus sp. BCO2]
MLHLFQPLLSRFRLLPVLARLMQQCFMLLELRFLRFERRGESGLSVMRFRQRLFEAGLLGP